MEQQPAPQYQGIGDLVNAFGFREAANYKFLELRHRYSWFNNLCAGRVSEHAPKPIPTEHERESSTGLLKMAFGDSYIAAWDVQGRLVYFNPNPSYPEDFRPVDGKTFQPVPDLTDEELEERTPRLFAEWVHMIMHPEKK